METNITEGKITDFIKIANVLGDINRTYNHKIGTSTRNCAPTGNPFSKINRLKVQECMNYKKAIAAREAANETKKLQPMCNQVTNKKACIDRLNKKIRFFSTEFEKFKALSLKAKKELSSIKEGITMSKIKDGQKLVDIAFDEGFEVFGKLVKAEKRLEKIMDTLECDMMGGPGRETDDQEFSEPDTDSNMEPEHVGPNTISHVPNQDGSELYAAVRRQLGEWARLNEDAKAEYKAFFDGMLKKYGVSSPAQLPADKKKAFFDAVDKGWKSKKENM